MLARGVGWVFSLLTLLTAQRAAGQSCTCVNDMCTNIPSNNEYYLTSFCDSSVACGSFSGDCNAYYSADYARFGCNSVSECVAVSF
jgi:hypothetical protein